MKISIFTNMSPWVEDFSGQKKYANGTARYKFHIGNHYAIGSEYAEE